MAKEATKAETNSPILVVGLGRGGSGKSTILCEMAWFAKSQGRNPIIADGDPRSKTLSETFPEATKPPTEELPDNKQWLSSVLNAAVREKRSAVIDLGTLDRLLLEYGRDLNIVSFCERRGIEPMAVYVMGPEREDLSHCLTIWEAGYFRPKRAVILLNEGAVRDGRTVAGAFEKVLADPGFQRMVADGVKPILLRRLGSMDAIKTLGCGFYRAANDMTLDIDPTDQDMALEWLEDLAEQRKKAGASLWMP